MSVPIQPLADYIVAQAEEPQSKTMSGLYLPDNAQEKPKIAKILAVGKTVKQVKVGDRIIYKGYTTTEIKLGSDNYIIVKEEDILATVK
jgi:chaperonin GroES